jgi:hypothetical protein
MLKRTVSIFQKSTITITWSDINVKIPQLLNSGESAKPLFSFTAPTNLSGNRLHYCIRASNHFVLKGLNELLRTIFIWVSCETLMNRAIRKAECCRVVGTNISKGYIASCLWVHDDGGSVLLRNVGNQLRHYTMPWPRRPQYSSPTPWKPQVTHGELVLL